MKTSGGFDTPRERPAGEMHVLHKRCGLISAFMSYLILWWTGSLWKRLVFVWRYSLVCLRWMGEFLLLIATWRCHFSYVNSRTMQIFVFVILTSVNAIGLIFSSDCADIFGVMMFSQLIKKIMCAWNKMALDGVILEMLNIILTFQSIIQHSVWEQKKHIKIIKL